MKKKTGKRHTPEQIIRKLREADGMIALGKTIGQVCQSLEVSEATFPPLAVSARKRPSSLQPARMSVFK